MKVLITGKPGIGKTTVIKRIASNLKDKALGFWTEEIRDKNGKRIGFEVITTDGKNSILAKKGLHSNYSVGLYGVDIEVFEKTVLPVLEEAKKKENVVIIDEIGKMELFSEKFLKAVKELFEDNKKTIIATIPVKNVHPFVKYLRENFPVIEVSYSNRDVLPNQILKYMEKESI